MKTSRKRVSRRRTSLRRNFRPRVGQKAQVSIGYGEWITGTVIKAHKGKYEVEVPSKTGSTIYGSSATHLRAAHGRRTSLRRNHFLLNATERARLAAAERAYDRAVRNAEARGVDPEFDRECTDRRGDMLGARLPQNTDKEQAEWDARYQRGTRSLRRNGAAQHETEEDCAGHIVDEECMVCGVTHNEACETCGKRGWHAEGCDGESGRSVRRNGKTPTFQAAKNAVMAYLEGQGWRVSGALKVPHATSPDGVVRLWFKPQAVWASVDQQGRSHTLGEARSVHSDIRAETPAGFAAGAVQSALRLDATLRQGGFRPNLASAGKSRRQLSSRGNSNDGSPTRGNSNDGSPL